MDILVQGLVMVNHKTRNDKRDVPVTGNQLISMVRENVMRGYTINAIDRTMLDSWEV